MDKKLRVEESVCGGGKRVEVDERVKKDTS